MAIVNHNWSILDQRLRSAISSAPYTITSAFGQVSLETGIPFKTLQSRWYKTLRARTREDSGKVFFIIGKSKSLTNTKTIRRVGETKVIDMGIAKARNEGRFKSILIGLFQTVRRLL